MQLTGDSVDMNRKWALLGANRGLGQSFHKALTTAEQDVSVLVISRKEMDFSQKQNWNSYLEKLRDFAPAHLVYFAAGGPFGSFQSKEWKDHEWALKVSFEFPTFLLHGILSEPKEWSWLRQICLIGSAIAESASDPGASSYAAAKHGLKGLVTSVQAEIKSGSLLQRKLDLRLFSPGYMDTTLLPPNAWPRQQSGLVKNPDDVAARLLAWLQSADDANGHLQEQQ